MRERRTKLTTVCQKKRIYTWYAGNALTEGIPLSGNDWDSLTRVASVKLNYADNFQILATDGEREGRFHHSRKQ